MLTAKLYTNQNGKSILVANYEGRFDLDKTPAAIIDFAAEVTQRLWDDKQEPYLLAELTPDLKSAGLDYREVLGGQRLKAFLEAAPTRVKLVRHPIQKAKIGLIPPDKTFTWHVPSAQPASIEVHNFDTEAPISGSKRRYFVTNFLRIVSELPNEERVLVQIPLHILTKLMRDR